MSGPPTIKPHPDPLRQGEVLVCEEIPMGKEFGFKIRNQIMTIEQAQQLVGAEAVQTALQEEADVSTNT